MPLLWKFLREGLKSEYGKCEWKVGEWKKEDKAETCHMGFHGSEKILDALSYVKGEVLARVEVRGECNKQDDKQAWTEMRIKKAYKWTKEESVKLAIFSAELVIELYEKQYPKDARPREAIEAAKTYLKDPSEKNRAAAYTTHTTARAAADAAAYAAAYATTYAAHAAARAAADAAAYTTRAAADAAADAAAYATTYAAHAAARAAAYAAAYAAAHAAAHAAADAAHAAAHAAAYTTRAAADAAADAAAHAAADATTYAAHAAARDKVLAKIEKYLLSRVKELEEIK